MNTMEYLLQHIDEIEKKIRYIFSDRSLLVLAFIHRSFLNENRMIKEHNERLEFLGDAVLGLLVSEYLYRTLPKSHEGDLSYLRSRLVEANSCMLYVRKLAIASYILMGKGEHRNDGRGRETILADFFEAVVGAIYLDGGLEATRNFLFHHFTEEFSHILKTPLSNWKAILQDYSQRTFQQAPFYQVLQESGPDHSKVFEIAVFINNQQVGKGTGSSKKEAQQEAARDAIIKCNIPEAIS